jgi:hypothetical protein
MEQQCCGIYDEVDKKLGGGQHDTELAAYWTGWIVGGAVGTFGTTTPRTAHRSLVAAISSNAASYYV